MGICINSVNAYWGNHGFTRFRKRLSKLARKDKDVLSLFDYFDGNTTQIPVECCKKVAPRLKEIVSSWSNDDYDKINGLKLVIGMEASILKNEPLLFC